MTTKEAGVVPAMYTLMAQPHQQVEQKGAAAALTQPSRQNSRAGWNFKRYQEE